MFKQSQVLPLARQVSCFIPTIAFPWRHWRRWSIVISRWWYFWRVVPPSLTTGTWWDQHVPQRRQLIPSGKQTWQWKMDHVSVMFLLYKIYIFIYTVNVWLPEGTQGFTTSFRIVASVPSELFPLRTPDHQFCGSHCTILIEKVWKRFQDVQETSRIWS